MDFRHYNNQIISNLLKIQPSPNKLNYLCREFCLKDISDNLIPRYCFLNNMMLEETPDCIKNLNFYEKLLIQKAKCFQTIIKLHTIRKNSKNIPISALKGTAINLPLNFEETNNYLLNSLPMSNVYL